MDETKSDNYAREMYQGGIVTLSVAPGILLLGAALALLSNAKIFLLMAAVSTLVGFIGAGLLIAGFVGQPACTSKRSPAD